MLDWELNTSTISLILSVLNLHSIIFFENDNVSMLDLNVNFHYLCPVAQSVKLYPLFGLTMSNWMFDMHDLDVDWDGDHVHVDDGG